MTAPQSLQTARELDAAIQHQDRLLLLSRARQVPAPFITRQLEVRNALVKQWAQTWQTRPVGYER